MRSRHLIWIESWFRERFPHHPNVYFGLSGTALLSEALALQSRDAAVVPGFFCPAISLMMLRARKQVTHIDSAAATLHPCACKLRDYLSTQNPANAILLIDHSFGYPFPGLARIRREFPDLLIIEDCARALGVEIAGRAPGDDSDWLLFSMYKTVPGSQNGGILLTREPLELRAYPNARVTLRECAAACGPLRTIRDWILPGPSFEPRPAPACLLGREPEWEPVRGSPSRLCAARFRHELAEFEKRREERRAIFDELTDGLSRIPGIDCIPVACGDATAAHFVSFKVAGSAAFRDSVLTALGRKRLDLCRIWEKLPFDYECFAGSYPLGSDGTRELGDRIAHIPVRWFRAREKGRALLRELPEILQGRKATETLCFPGVS